MIFFNQDVNFNIINNITVENFRAKSFTILNDRYFFLYFYCIKLNRTSIRLNLIQLFYLMNFKLLKSHN